MNTEFDPGASDTPSTPHYSAKVRAYVEHARSSAGLELPATLEDELDPATDEGTAVRLWAAECKRFSAPHVELRVHPITGDVGLVWYLTGQGSTYTVVETLRRAAGHCTIDESPEQFVVRGLSLSEARLTAALISHCLDAWSSPQR